MTSDAAALREQLSHVLWVGGATDSGKTSVANALVERHGWQAYHYDLFDRLELPGHWARIDPDRHPWMHGMDLDPEAQWVNTTPEQLVESWLGSTRERFEMTIEDLLEMPGDLPIVADGYGFLPALVAPLLSAPGQAIWLVSTEEFKRASYARRNKGNWQVSDPERARYNHIERDLRIAQIIRDQAQQLELPYLDIDGSLGLDHVIERVARAFSAYVE